jgi:2,4-dienoyl-CoA reductase-like NADH-dependent reductase (Old Yellow Enzyme family)
MAATEQAQPNPNPASALAQPLKLPCGVEIPNRVVKGAMTEQLADENKSPTEELFRLYERWGQGGTGVLLTGNVMVDRRALEGPRNVAVEDDRDLDKLKEWAARAQLNGSQLWMQISHPGRQTPRGVSDLIVAPSAVPLQGRLRRLFSPPRELTVSEIEEIIGRFGVTAEVAKRAGFSGVQIHGAHGYLNSQFLNPLVNLREDEWGGTSEKRMRFLLEVVKVVREKVGPDYPISVKLNSADFQRGGFTEEDSMKVVSALEGAGIDLLEISGGSYEKTAFMGTADSDDEESDRESTRLREAYFLEYAKKVRARTRLPLLLTGGLRTVSVMSSIIDEGLVDCVGLARPLTIHPDFTRDAIEGRIEQAAKVKVELGIKMFDDMLQSLWHQEQMKLMARGKEPDLKLSRLLALGKGIYNTFG